MGINIFFDAFGLPPADNQFLIWVDDRAGGNQKETQKQKGKTKLLVYASYDFGFKFKR